MQKKILYHHRIASQDGQQVHIEEIVRALRDQGHDVSLIGPSFHGKTSFGHDGGFVSSMKKKMPKWAYELLELGYSAIVAFRLVQEIMRQRPDFIYERYNLYQPAGVMIAKLFKIPLLLEVNAPLFQERTRFSGGIGLPWLAKAVENFTWRHADKVLPVTEVLAGHLRRAGVDNSRIEVIHNGVREALINQLRERQVGKHIPEQTVIGFVGFMHLTCGVDWVMEAIAESRDPSLKLVCVGDGNILPVLKEKADSLGINAQVEFTGLVGRDEIMAHIARFDIAIQPDVTAYASPLKLFEYMANRCLIIAPESDNILEIIDHNNAVLFQHGDKTAFKQAMMRAIKEIRSGSEKRDAVFKRLVDGGFIWDENARRIVRIADVVS